MTYLKCTFIDKFQNEKINYLIIDYDLMTNFTISESIMIYDKYYDQFVIDKISGDISIQLVENELKKGYKEKTKKDFDLDVKNKKCKYFSKK
jgi:hypothetical protein